MNIKEKRGIIGQRAQSHIETILSFVIFAGFLFTLLIFFNPIKQTSTSVAILDFAERQIIDNLSISHEKISLILDAVPSSACFSIPNSIGVGEVVLVKDSKEEVVNSKISGDYINIETKTGERYYVIYYNSTLNEYESEVASCSSITDYSFGLHDQDKLVLYENLVAFNKSYNENYEALRVNLHLNSEFVFSVFNQSNYLIMGGDRPRPSAINLLSRNIPLLAVNKDMNRTDVILNIRVWE